ncbi:hypothetical protein [Pelagibacterium montanilacus]|uniref:hypothetical protein n=1 Tax=Pelagibacterium montanilacus TaxID=2185280 RepID=UPI000F8D9B4E|nr:hypothetical protein [Pelagibacterium montanilacus]
MLSTRSATIAVFASLLAITSAQAAEGHKRYGKCVVMIDVGGRQVPASYDCNDAGVSCPNPGWDTACTVNGVSGTTTPGDAERAVRAKPALM